MYQHPEIFSSESITPWDPDPVYRFVPTQIDPPDHAKYRQLISRWFAPNAVNRIAPQAHEIGQRLVADLAPKGECDFVTDFAMRLPTEIFLTIIGVPSSDADLFVPWVEDFFAGFGGDLEQQQAMGAALGGIRQYWVDVLEARRDEAEPRENDFASLLLHSTVDDEPLDDALILDILTVLVLAGLDTTRGQLGYLFRHLAEHPDDRHRLIAEPELIPSAVEESLRLYTIIFGDGRKVAQDTEFHGCPAQQGRHGLRAGLRRQPGPAGLRPPGRVHRGPQGQQPPRLRGRPAPLPRRAPGPDGHAGRRRGVAEGHPRLRGRDRGAADGARRRRHDDPAQPPADAGRCRHEADRPQRPLPGTRALLLPRPGPARGRRRGVT